MAEPLADRLEAAILEILMWGGRKYYQNHWGGWEQEVQAKVSDVAQPDLLSALKRLWKSGYVELTKPDDLKRDAIVYTGEQSDTDFFLTGLFNADITDDGWAYRDRLPSRKSGGRIGFVP